MKIIKVENRDQGVLEVAKVFMGKSAGDQDAPVGLATGATMLGVYEALATLGFKPGFHDAFALDEYEGLSADHPNSYARYLDEHFAKALGFAGQIHVPGQGDYVGTVGLEAFEASIDSLGPISVQLLGLGPNGHVAFNEPGSEPTSTTRRVELANETIAANRQYFDPPTSIPGFAFTQGLATISKAQSLIVAAFGEEKREALNQALDVTGAETPFSAIRNHQDLSLVTDLLN